MLNLIINLICSGRRYKLNGWHGVSTKRIPCWATNQFCRFNQIRGSPVLNCWPVACDDNLAMGLGFVIHVSKIGCVNIPGTDSHYPYAFHVFIPTSASSFTMFHPWTLPPTVLCHWATAFEPHPCSQQAFSISRFTTSVLPRLSRESPRVHFAWEPQLTFELALSSIV